MSIVTVEKSAKIYYYTYLFATAEREICMNIEIEIKKQNLLRHQKNLQNLLFCANLM